MYSHLKEHYYYEDLYDRHTVDEARRNIKYYNDFQDELKAKLPKDETTEKPRNAFALNVFYMQTVGNELLERYENRDSRIAEWTARDRFRDEQVSSARLVEGPHCRHCGGDELRITDKSLLHRQHNGNYDDPELVLFTLHCSHCDKNSAYWEDGIAWDIKPTLCPKCQTEMQCKTTHTKKALTSTYACPSCQHTYKERLDLSIKESPPDPNFEGDRVHYCLHDAEFRDRLFTIRHGFLEMARFGKEWKEREDNKHVYDAIKAMKKLKIAELSPILQPILESASYIDFSLDKPEVGKDVFVGFNCLDTNSERSDYDSKKVLEKLIEETLEGTNWRLMSDGISYRLGYLSGRLRAYEKEDDLKKLFMKNKRSQEGTSKTNPLNEGKPPVIL